MTSVGLTGARRHRLRRGSYNWFSLLTCRRSGSPNQGISDSRRLLLAMSRISVPSYSPDQLLIGGADEFNDVLRLFPRRCSEHCKGQF